MLIVAQQYGSSLGMITSLWFDFGGDSELRAGIFKGLSGELHTQMPNFPQFFSNNSDKYTN